MTTYRKFPADEAEIFLREQIGEDGEAAPKLHGKVDQTKQSADNANTAISNLSTKVGTPADTSVSQDIANVQAEADAISAELANATYGLAALKTETDNIDTAVAAVNTKLGTPAGASVSADIAAVKLQTNNIEGDTQDIQTKIGTPVNGSVSLDIAEVMAAVSGLQNDTTFSAYVPEQLERPIVQATPQPIEYLILVDHKDQLGNMEDFDAAPAVAIENTEGTDRSSYLYNAAGSQTTTMDHDGTGQYSLRIRVYENTTIENLMVTITALEATKTRIKRLPARVDESFSDHFNTADRTTINTTKTNTDNLVTRLGTPTSGTVASHVEATEAAVGVVDGKVVAVKGVVDSIFLDTAAIKGAGFGAGDSLKEISDAISVLSGGAQPMRAVKQSGSIAQGAFEEVVLGTAEGFKSQNAELFLIKVRPTTTTSTNFRVRLYERSGQSGLDYLVADWQKLKATNDQGGLWTDLLGVVFLNRDVAPGSNLYLRIDNVTDSGSSVFDVEVRAKSLGALA